MNLLPRQTRWCGRTTLPRQLHVAWQSYLATPAVAKRIRFRNTFWSDVLLKLKKLYLRTQRKKNYGKFPKVHKALNYRRVVSMGY